MAGPIDTPLGARLFAYQHSTHKDKVLLYLNMQDPKDVRHVEVLLSENNVYDLVIALLEGVQAVRRSRDD